MQVFATTSARELIQEAPQTFVSLLAEQLGVRQQAQLAKKFGAGQGYLVELPHTGKRRKERNELADWLRALGFSSGVSLDKNVLRVSSLKAEAILREVHRREMPNFTESVIITNSEHLRTGANDIVCHWNRGEDRAVSDDEANEEVDMQNTGADAAEGVGSEPDPVAQSRILDLKSYYRDLDAQELEVVSFAENKRLLSSSRHVEIAEAMEDILAQPSARKDRSRAKRMSKLGRISGRRLSFHPRMSSMAPGSDDENDSDVEIGILDFASPIKPKRKSRSKESLSAKKKGVLGEKCLGLVLLSGYVAPRSIKAVVCNVSSLWRRIGIVYVLSLCIIADVEFGFTHCMPLCSPVHTHGRLPTTRRESTFQTPRDHRC